MDTIPILIVNIVPLYLLIGLGYVAGRWLQVDLHSMARIAIFILSPIVMFGAIARLQFTPALALLPLVTILISTVSSQAMYRLAELSWKNNTANLIGVGSVSGNTGYFGLPLVIAMHGSDWVGPYLMLNFGISVTESTIGYFLGARGHHSVKESLIKVAKLPVLHALYLGLLFNATGIAMPEVAVKFWTNATGAWTFIGMMLIGVALAKMPKFEFDGRLLRWIFAAKFLVWPLLGLSVILFDRAVTHVFSPMIYGLILILVSVPPPSNLVAYATQLNLHPEKAAVAVLLGTLFAVVFMPAFFLLAGYLFELSP